jgi:hypothetical protein
VVLLGGLVEGRATVAIAGDGTERRVAFVGRARTGSRARSSYYAVELEVGGAIS